MTAIISCNATAIQTIGEIPHFRAKKFMTGNKRNMGRKELIPTKNKFLAPHRLTSFAKKKAWKTPLTRPNIPRMVPMVDGERLRPPYSIGDE